MLLIWIWSSQIWLTPIYAWMSRLIGFANQLWLCWARQDRYLTIQWECQDSLVIFITARYLSMHDILDYCFVTIKILFPLCQVRQLVQRSSHNYEDIYLRLVLSAVHASSTFIVAANLLMGETHLNLVGDSWTSPPYELTCFLGGFMFVTDCGLCGVIGRNFLTVTSDGNCGDCEGET